MVITKTTKLCILTSFLLQSYAHSAQIDKTSLLVGGALKSCSSLSQKNCNDHAIKNFTHKSAKKSPKYLLNEKKVKKILSHSSWQGQDALLSLLDKALTKSSALAGSDARSKSSLKSLFKKTQLRVQGRNITSWDVLNLLTDPQYDLVLDYLEEYQGSETKRLTEKVSLKDTLNQDSIAIYQRFVELAANAKTEPKKEQLDQNKAGREKPTVLVMTSSARDPLEAVDFYTQVFAQAGADTKWLPLDASLVRAQNTNQCDKLDEVRGAVQGSYNRSVIYPDLHQIQTSACQDKQQLLDLIKQAGGIFINGGDQFKTYQALINKDGSDNDYMALIRSRYEQGELVLGGTSAGTAVTSGIPLNGQTQGSKQKAEFKTNPMITSGSSYAAVHYGAFDSAPPAQGCERTNTCNGLPNNALTFNPTGGIATASIGVMDTHFTERNRQLRLAVLTNQTQANFGFGVDENTALLIKQYDTSSSLEVVGESGVYVIDNTAQTEHKVMTHYLGKGETATIKHQRLSVSVNNASKVTDGSTSQVDQLLDADNYLQATNRWCQQGLSVVQSQSLANDSKVTMTLTPTAKSKLNHGKRCYYHNILLDWTTE